VFSAKKVDGKRAYAVARAGGELTLPPVPVTVRRFEVLQAVAAQVDGHPVLDMDVEILCSKGTYIRSLARDLGADLGVGGTLTALRRTSSGDFTEAECMPLDVLVERIRGLAGEGVDVRR
jgi:tRNA pseudouridine55 synthase